MAVSSHNGKFILLLVLKIQDEWKGKTAAGLPCAANKNAQLGDNPQFALTIKKPSTAFIKVTQKEALNAFKGRSPIFFMVAKNKGYRVTRMNREIMVGKPAPPTDLKVISAEVVFDASMDYPQTFTIMAASAYAGEKGEGQFDIKVYVNNQFEFKKIPFNKRKQKH